MNKKFNWVDYLIIFISILILLLFIYRFYYRDKNQLVNNKDSFKKVVLLKLEEAPEFYKEVFQEGDKIYLTSTDEFVGQIKRLEISRAHTNLIRNDGSLVQAEIPEKYNIYLYVESNLLEREAGYYIAGVTEVLVNNSENFYTDRAIFLATIKAILE